MIQPSSLGGLVRAIAILALDPLGQQAYLEKLGVGKNVDELALDFYDFALLAPQMLDLGWLSQEALKDVKAVDKLLNKMSGPENRDLWTKDALGATAQWQEVRTAARSALCLF